MVWSNQFLKLVLNDTILLAWMRFSTNYQLKKQVVLFLLLLVCISATAQKKNETYRLELHKAKLLIKVDGVGSDPAWQDCEVATDFYMVLPMDTSKSRVHTEVRMSYDDKNIYLLATCFHALAGPYYVESLRRDFNFGKNDNFLLFIDPFDDQTNGFSFGANAHLPLFHRLSNREQIVGTYKTRSRLFVKQDLQ